MRPASSDPPPTLKPLEWVASSRKDLKAMPEDVQDVFGYALQTAQEGGKTGNAKPLRGFGGASVLEVSDDYDGDTYRAVYTVRFARAVYVLHVFQKKSTRGIATSGADLELIRLRFGAAEQHYRENYEVEQSTGETGKKD